MSSKLYGLALLSAVAGKVAADGEPFSFCVDGKCDDCPVSVNSAGTGFPECVVYNSDDFFGGGDFEAADGGGYMPYLDVQSPDPNCKTIVKSPASTSVEGCGKIIGAFSSETCATMPLKNTFMVQFCCGEGDCESAGSPFKRSTSSSSASGGLYLKFSNGSVIEPAERGQPKGHNQARQSEAINPLTKRGSCEDDSWVADEGKDSYTRPADGGQVVYAGIGSGQKVTITSERSSTYTQSLSQDFGFADVISLGVSFSEEFSETTTDGSSREFSAKEGQTGDVVFTPFLRCSTGTATCDNGDLHGEVCTGYKDSTGKIRGEYTVVVTS